MTRIGFALIIVAFCTLAFAGEEDERDWKEHVIPAKERMFDFKTVAKGAVPEYQFVLKNPLQDPMHIGGITSSCKCTDIHFDETKTVLKTYEEFILTVRLRGDQYEGQRNATITVVIDKPVRSELQLNIRGEIRTDLKITPKNSIEFGTVDLGKGKKQQLTVTYTGPNTQWRIVDAKCENKFIRIGDLTSEYFVGKKEFKVDVFLDKSVPQGNFNALLTLISNDTESRREIPIFIRAAVGTVIRITPPSAYLGTLSPGEPSLQKDVLVVGTKPFRITKVECDNPAIDISLKIDVKEPPQTFYRLPIVYKNPLEGAGAPIEENMLATIRITTDVPDLAPLTFYATAKIVKQDGEE